MLYEIVYTWHEEYQSILLEGPKVADWTEFCDQFVDEAARMALGREEEWVGLDDIVKCLADILLLRGYRKLSISAAKYWGGGIVNKVAVEIDRVQNPERGLSVLSKGILNRLVEHNAAVKKKIDAEAEAQFPIGR